MGFPRSDTNPETLGDFLGAERVVFSLETELTQLKRFCKCPAPVEGSRGEQALHEAFPR